MKFGIKEIDDQHAEIAEIIEGIIEAVDSRKGILDVHYRVVHLYDVTARHFALEESLMRIFRYPLQDEHATLHAGMLAKIDELKRMSLRTGEVDWAELDAKKMVLTHIDSHDRKLCEFVLAQRPDTAAAVLTAPIEQ